MKLSSIKAFKIIVFVIATAIVAYCLPRGSENEMSYELNRPWGYGLLTAPFDIPVHMDTVTARQICDSIDRAFEPVMGRDLVAEKELVSQAASQLSRVQGISGMQKNAIVRQLRQLYEQGIVPRDVYDKVRSGDLQSVRFIHDNVAISMPTSQFLSPRAAYAKLDSVFGSPAMQSAMAQAGLASLVRPTVTPDSAASRRLLEESYQRATAPTGVIQQGERIIDKGDIVTLRLATVLDTFKKMARERDSSQVNREHYPLAGQLLYIMLCFGCLYGYLYFFRRDYYNNHRVLLFLLVMVVGFTLFAFGMRTYMRLGIYLVPIAMVPLLVHIFLDSRTAVFTNLVTVMLTAMVVSLSLEFIFMQFVAGVVAITSLHELTRRSQLIRTAALVFISYCLSFLAVEVMQAGIIGASVPKMMGCFAVNAVFICFSYILMFVLERLFGFTSRVTLVELSDINNPLLRELSEECPGTFQHSMSVSNLSSAAAARIGANAQLVRTGALYHDVGKIKNPAFYTENQHGINPHDSLDPMQSARIVTGHVKEGLALAEKAKLPQVIRDFISQHHGKGAARYFYNTYCNNHPGEEVDPEPFSYPGPNPRTPETSIVMMADAVEAASRSLKEHTPEAIKALVDKIVNSQIAAGLHNESSLSFRDVKAIKDVFVQRLLTLYHSRISYPELKKTEPEPQGSQSSTPQ